MGGFTAALQAAHQKNGGRFCIDVHPVAFGAHQRGQLFADDLDDLLGGGEAFHHFGAHTALGHLGNKIFCHFIVDIGFQQGHTHFAHGDLDIGFGQFALAAQAAKGSGQFFC
ncbi:hypothetical protein SDC9_138633 [bioreactor metagenome]|uniref:Uncharacterized protein n=1 Tax=bioreactor metagenome TaxID=1076179 RepID=A0A645DSS4_9ZZZZ